MRSTLVSVLALSVAACGMSAEPKPDPTTDPTSSIVSSSCTGLRFHYPHGTLDELRAAKPVVSAHPRPIFDLGLQSNTCGATLSQSFDGISSTESDCNCRPPDGALAVGPTDVVGAVNDAMKVWDKSGNLIAGPTNLTTLMAPTGDTLALFADPYVVYDAGSDRYVISMVNYNSGETSSTLNVAVTTTNDPTGSWTVYAFPAPTGDLFDFPKIAIDGSVLYATGNLFSGSPPNQTLVAARAMAMDLSQMYAGTAPTPVVHDVTTNAAGHSADTLIPAQNDGASGVMYFLSADNQTSGGSNISLYRWADPLGTNSFALQGGVAVAAYAQPPEPQSFGLLVATNDARDLVAYYYGGTLYGAHGAGFMSDSVAAVQWYQIGDLDGTPTLLQQGTNATNGEHRWLPNLALDGSGNLLMTYAYMTSGYIGIRATARYASQPAGVLEPEFDVVDGDTQDTTSRWGDYGTTVFDGTNFWSLLEYEHGPDWTVRVSQFALDTTTPDFDVAVAPNFVEVVGGNAATYTVSTDVCNGYSGTVALSASNLPSNATASFSPTSITGQGSSTLTLQTALSTPEGASTFSVSGTDGTLTHVNSTTRLQDDQPSFFLSPSNYDPSIPTTGSTQITVTSTPFNGYAGTIDLTATGLPSGVTYSYSPSAIGPSGSSTLTFTSSGATPGGYAVNIVGTDSLGNTMSSTQITLTVTSADFSISVSPSSASVKRGQAASYTVTISAIGGFTGSVSLSATGQPSHTTTTFTPSSINGHGTSTMKIQTQSTTPTGTSQITVKGTSSSLQHTANTSLTVTAH